MFRHEGAILGQFYNTRIWTQYVSLRTYGHYRTILISQYCNFYAYQHFVCLDDYHCKLGSFGSIPLCIDRIYVSEIMPSKHNSLPSIIYLVTRLKYFDPLLGHQQAYIKTRKCITFYILRAKRDLVWFTGLYTVCTGSDDTKLRTSNTIMVGIIVYFDVRCKCPVCIVVRWYCVHGSSCLEHVVILCVL
jgi:hypothetical protein